MVHVVLKKELTWGQCTHDFPKSATGRRSYIENRNMLQPDVEAILFNFELTPRRLHGHDLLFQENRRTIVFSFTN